MAIPAILLPLLGKGLDLIANAAMAKGKHWVKEKTGVDLDADNLSSADYVALQKYQMEHEAELLRIKQDDDKLSASIQEMYLADTKSARTMQIVALNQEDLFAKRFIYFFAIFWSVAAVAFIFAITFMSIPETSVRFADTILGFVLGTIIAQIIAYFFGSSLGSKSKDEMKDSLLKRAIP